MLGAALPPGVVAPGTSLLMLAAAAAVGDEAAPLTIFSVLLSAPLSSVSPIAEAKNNAARIPVVRVSTFAVPRTDMKPLAPPPPMPSPPPSERCSRITATSASTISR